LLFFSVLNTTEDFSLTEPQHLSHRQQQIGDCGAGFSVLLLCSSSLHPPKHRAVLLHQTSPKVWDLSTKDKKSHFLPSGGSDIMATPPPKVYSLFSSMIFFSGLFP
jgi:hypothetical protein